MSYRIFDKITDYFSGWDLHCEIREIEEGVNRISAIEGNVEGEERIRKIKNFDLYSRVMTGYIPNLCDAMIVGGALAEHRAPYEILAIEILRILARCGTRILTRAMKKSLESNI